MKKRLIVAGILIGILGAAFAFRLIPTYGVYVFDLFIGAICIFCALEFAKLLTGMGYTVCNMAAGLYPSFMFAGHMSFFLFNLDFYLYFVIQLGLLIAAFLTVFIVYLCLNTKQVIQDRTERKMGKLKYALSVSSKTFLTFVYPSTFLLSLMFLNRIDLFGLSSISVFGGYFGWVVLILAFAIPIITDSTAMLCGMAFKGPKLCPTISPNKTISGAVSSIILTSVIVGALFFAFNAFSSLAFGFSTNGIQMYHFLIFGFVGSIVCQCGDIFESYLKRKANVKDSGNIFPGHGGFLDRFDSHIFNALFVLLFVALFIMI